MLAIPNALARNVGTTAFALLLFAIAGYGQPDTDIVIGRAEHVSSKVLGREVELSIFLPASYKDEKRSYPVLYIVQSDFLLGSGIASWLNLTNQAPELIVISLETYRSGDFTPVPIEGKPGTGGADDLLRFFKEELFPSVDSRYRVAPYRIFYSGSWGGAFGVYAMLARPDVFNACVTASPWIDFEGSSNYIEQNAASLLQEHSYEGRFLYMAAENDASLLPVLERLKGILEAGSPRGLNWEYHPFPDEDHSSIPVKTLFAGLRSLYRPWREVPPDVAAAGAEGLRAYRARLAAEFGYDMGLSFAALFSAGRNLLNEQDYEKAVGVFRLCIESHPERPFGYSWLGRSLESAGRLSEALEAFQDAFDTAARQRSPHMHVFQGDLDRIKQKLSEK